jgi:uncharacterized repeat protein (TIGR03803 family)
MLVTNRLAISCGLLLGSILLNCVPSSAQTFHVIHDVNCTTDGCNDQQPIPMAQGRDGNMYGRMYSGGVNNLGTGWKVSPGGTFTDFYNFAATEGNNAAGGLTLALDGNFYGSNAFDGANNIGFVYKLTPAGVFTNLHSFTSVEGGLTGEPLTLGPDGNLYGIDGYNCYFYKITVATGTYSNISNTCGPNTSYALTLGADGKFYGITMFGGTNNLGTFFSITTAGVVTTIHSFNGTDGEYPVGNVVQATDGNFYGVTSQTPTNSFAGEIYKITPAGTVTVLHVFAADGSEGANVVSGLLAASDGNLYGTTNTGGLNSNGVLYEITRTGTFTKLRDFTSSTDGSNNWVPLGQRTDGTLYGTGQGGGTNNTGTVYTLSSASFPRFVIVENYSAASPRTIDILGNALTGATAVNFGTIPATSFKVMSDNFMTAVVPPTAITGLVSVTTPTGTVSTQTKLKVLPTVTSFTPTSGTVGTPVTITGMGLTGATRVTFGNVKATSFTVNSATQITATVPTGAVTGAIAVTTAGGTGSKGTFTVN